MASVDGAVESRGDVAGRHGGAGPELDRAVVAVVQGLVDELGGARRTVVRGDHSLDRDLGLGSLERVELLLRLERAFGVRLGDEAMVAADSPADLASALASALAGGLPKPPPRAPLPTPRSASRPAPGTTTTLVEVLRWHADATPEAVHLYLRENERELPLTYGELYREAEAVATGLGDRGLAPGERVALMLRTEPAFFPTFLGVLLAGGIPVPIYPPYRFDRIEDYVGRQAGILRDAGATRLVTFPEARQVAGVVRSRVPALGDVADTAELSAGGARATHATAASSDVALIQYTSGSTGDPKGVQLTHANILANVRAIGEAIAIGSDDVGASWLPLHHNMGLIGSWLVALHFGVPLVILSPLAFLARPVRWLRAIHEHRATISAAPNFAYQLCVRQITDAELEGLDLGSWRLALNGSEPVDRGTMERFALRFARHGFRIEAMCPVYGLAEATVALTVSAPGHGLHVDRIDREGLERAGVARPAPAAADAPAGTVEVVSCGRPLPGHRIRIVDEAGRQAGDRAVGRVEFQGPSVTPGYFGNPAATAASLHDGWMDSGDLGYFAGDELFLTGRRKDLIIKGGRNLYPQEIEASVGEVPGVDGTAVAAFGVPDPATGTERLVVALETVEAGRVARSRLRAAVVERVVAAIGIPPDMVVLCPPGAIPKTANGKVRRGATRAAYLDGRLEEGRPSTGGCPGQGRPEARLARARRLAAGAARTIYGWSLTGASLAVLGATLPFTPRGDASDLLARRWSRWVLDAMGCQLRVEGLDHLPRFRAVVLVANHSSYVDAVALLAAIPVPFRFVAKRELLRVPVVGHVIRRVGHLTVDRTDLSRRVADAEQVGAALRRGMSVLVFPEGTFRGAPGLLPFRLGAFKAAIQTGCPVVPVTIHGTRDILAAGTWRLGRASVTVRVGAPIEPDGPGWAEMVRLRDRARAEIATALEDIGEAAAPPR